MTLFMFMSCSTGKMLVVIFIKGGMARVAWSASTCFQCVQSLSLGKKAGLEADKPACRQNIVIIASNYKKTVSLSYKTNKVHLKDVTSCGIHRRLRFKASFLLAECD